MKNQLRKSGGWVVLGFLVLGSMAACTKNASINAGSQPGPNQSKLSIFMTDAPGFFDSVNIDIQSIEVKIDTANRTWTDSLNNNEMGDDRHHENELSQDDWGDDHHAIWDTLPMVPGIYDLLQFSNGLDTMFSSAILPQGKILAIKLSLGDNNTVVKNSVTYPLNLLPEWHNVYIRLHGEDFEKVTTNNFKIWIDFDMGHSIFSDNGKFYLRPFLKAFAVNNTGRVEGQVLPHDAFPVIEVYNATDTGYALPGEEGYFMVRGLAAGTYTVFINASSPYQDTTISNVTLQAGTATNLGKITLHQ